MPSCWPSDSPSATAAMLMPSTRLLHTYCRRGKEACSVRWAALAAAGRMPPTTEGSYARCAALFHAPRCPVSCTALPVQESHQAHCNLASRVWPTCSYFGCSACARVSTVDDFLAHGQQEGLSCPQSGLVPTALQYRQAVNGRCGLAALQGTATQVAHSATTGCLLGVCLSERASS